MADIKTIYLVRHGETEWNTIRKMQGHQDSPLTEHGLKQAEWLHKRFKDIQVDVVYTSPLGRAKMTAKTIIGDRHIPIIENDALKEIYLGSWEGQLISEVKENDALRTHHFWNEPHKYVPLDGEYMHEVQDRVVKFFEHIIRKPGDETIIVVAHAIVLKNLLNKTLDMQIKDLWNGPNIHPTSVTKAVIEVSHPDMYHIDYHYIGCTRHYEEESKSKGWFVDN